MARSTDFSGAASEDDAAAATDAASSGTERADPAATDAAATDTAATDTAATDAAPATAETPGAVHPAAMELADAPAPESGDAESSAPASEDVTGIPVAEAADASVTHASAGDAQATSTPVTGAVEPTGERSADDGEPAPAGRPSAAVEVPAGIAWSRLRDSLRVRPTRLQALAGVLLFLLGFAVITQARQTSESGLSALRESDLVRLLDDVTERRERLERESSDLQEQSDLLLNSNDAAEEARRAADERLDTYAILAGTVAAVGPGVELAVQDPAGEVDAPFLLDAVQELRDAGAEALQIGDSRVVANTAFVDVAGGVQVAGTVQRPPYTIRAIGDPDVLVPALSIPGGVLQGLEQRGAEALLTESDQVVVDALRIVENPQYAQPAPPEE